MVRRVLGAAATTLLVVAAVGLASWFVFAHLTGATLITFRTGSMAPTMPQGSVAVTLPVEAADIRIGDVVTTRRAGEELPVTHRVVEVRTPDEATQSERIPDDARELVLRGDDNAEDDFLPYVVRDAKRVVFSMPHAGAWLMVLQSPLGFGLLLLGAGALTTWAFWPARREDGRPDDDTADEAPAAGAGGARDRTTVGGRRVTLPAASALPRLAPVIAVRENPAPPRGGRPLPAAEEAPR